MLSTSHFLCVSSSTKKSSAYVPFCSFQEQNVALCECMCENSQCESVQRVELGLCTERNIPTIPKRMHKVHFCFILVSNSYREKVVSCCCFFSRYYSHGLDSIARSYITQSPLHHGTREARNCVRFFLSDEGRALELTARSCV